MKNFLKKLLNKCCTLNALLRLIVFSFANLVFSVALSVAFAQDCSTYTTIQSCANNTDGTRCSWAPDTGKCIDRHVSDSSGPSVTKPPVAATPIVNCDCRLSWSANNNVLSNSLISAALSTSGRAPLTANECSKVCKGALKSKCDEMLNSSIESLKGYCSTYKDGASLYLQFKWGTDGDFAPLNDHQSSLCGNLSCGVMEEPCQSGCTNKPYYNVAKAKMVNTCQKIIKTLPVNGSGDSEELAKNHVPAPNEWYIYQNNVFQFCEPATPALIDHPMFSNGRRGGHGGYDHQGIYRRLAPPLIMGPVTR